MVVCRKMMRKSDFGNRGKIIICRLSHKYETRTRLLLETSVWMLSKVEPTRWNVFFFRWIRKLRLVERCDLSIMYGKLWCLSNIVTHTKKWTKKCFSFLFFSVEHQIIGVVSAGYSCATRGQPGIYHRVPYTVDWISYVTSTTT